MKKLLTLLLIGLFSFQFMGCNTVKEYIDNESIVAKSAVQYGTLKYIERDDDNYDEVVKYTSKLKTYVEGGEYQALDVLFVKIKEDITQSDLDASEKLIALNIVDATKEYTTAKLEAKGLSLEEYKATALTLIEWIEEAAELSQMGVTSSQIE